jgi:hypothetical protein
MKPPVPTNQGLSRRTWLVLVGTSLSACGGGGGGGTGGVTAGLAPGTGGTGAALYSQGAISGFGSVIINGIRFDDSLASVQVDGRAAASTELRLGMVAGVQGTRSTTDTTLGTANVIEVWSIAQGLVTNVNGRHFETSGMTIQTDSNTSLEGFDAASPLLAGQTVTVWGLQADADGALWTATRVAVVNASDNRVSTGLVRRVGDHYTVNGWTLSGAATEALRAGQVVRVQGMQGSGSTMEVSGVRQQDSGVDAAAGSLLEIEGVVTQVLTGNRFMVGNITVECSSPALLAIASGLALGDRIEVYGSWTATVLVASQIKFEGSQSQEIEIEARIEQFVSLSNFVLRGQRCDASSAVFKNGKATDLQHWTGKVEVKGYKSGDVLRVTELEFAK